MGFCILQIPSRVSQGLHSVQLTDLPIDQCKGVSLITKVYVSGFMSVICYRMALHYRP